MANENFRDGVDNPACSINEDKESVANTDFPSDFPQQHKVNPSLEYQVRLMCEF